MRPWRRVAIPHKDVSDGRYKQAEFAADLAEVIKGTAGPEYQDPVEFFNRTYLTGGMKRLVKTAMERVTGAGGEPVVKLKTSFGGGKTHTMLAIYHLFSGTDSANLKGIPALMAEVKIESIPKCATAVLVGTDLDPTKPTPCLTSPGIMTRTLWGEMAAQLGGVKGYELVRTADEKGVAPGGSTIVDLFDTHGPCIILIDELVAYARNIYDRSDLPSGTFSSLMTFIQNLTEAAKRSNAIILASIPASKIEIGGDEGKKSLEKIEHTIGRLESIWEPVGVQESFEIVRSRLFSKISNMKARDATCLAFHEMYREMSSDFPTECKDKPYLDLMKNSYPFHPELFDRLYEDWATLEKFQRTRGVLRLLADVIHELWSANDQSPLIMPCHLPLYSSAVRNELTRYLGDQWSIIVDRDVDGEQSEPRRIDKETTRFGALSAARRVSRTIFLGSAPSVRQQNLRGIEDVRIRLGVAQPEENLPVFADALSRLCDRLTYLYHDNRRYWYDTRPNLRRTVEDRAAQWEVHEVEEKLRVRIQSIRDRADFAKVHSIPDDTNIPDDQEVRLVILGPKDSHHVDKLGVDTPAQKKVGQILATRGTATRLYKNTLIFLAPDTYSMETCLTEIRHNLAWQSVLDDKDSLNLDASQERIANEYLEKTSKMIELKIIETYCWVIVPTQSLNDNGEVGKETTLNTQRVTGGQDESIVARVSRKIIREQQLITAWSPLLLKMELDQILWKNRDDILVQNLWDYLTSYPYLSRLANEKVLLDAIRSGLATRDFFGYAAGKSPSGKYLGLVIGIPNHSILMDKTSLLVKPDVAIREFEPIIPPGTIPPTGSGDDGAIPLWTPSGGGPPVTPPVHPPVSPPEPAMTRFHGSVQLDPVRVIKDATQINDEVLLHMTTLPDVEVEVTMEIQIKAPGGIPERVVKIVGENARTLKIAHGFEKE